LAANTASTLAAQHRKSDLCITAGACNMRRTGQMQIITEDAERRVLDEIDACYVCAHGFVCMRHAETQSAVMPVEGEEMALERAAMHMRQLVYDDTGIHANQVRHGRRWNTSSTLHLIALLRIRLDHSFEKAISMP